MNVYRLSFHVDDDIEAESLKDAWEMARDRIHNGYYGPTQANLELDHEIVEEPTD